MDEAARQRRNAEKLAECFPPFAERVRLVLNDMEAMGFRPRIQQASRTAEEQAAALAKGTSEVSFSFHQVTGAGGKKEALACDIPNDDNPFKEPPRYYVALAISARRHGLETLIKMGLKNDQRAKVDAAIASGNPDTPCPIGKDPTHVQPTGMTTTEAKNGKRPTFGAAPASTTTPPAGTVTATSISTGGHIHVVQSGESLSIIAKRNNTTVDRILELNPKFKPNPNLIHVGDEVRLD